ncbi:rCG61587 [Rattus norvegicus]|uniref:RCG61587 n=1 Tax=Rattus norvegicus TaxID=10116 RepID=A6HAQ5_RAT|nr:rCG61587 [Rattus norvegicus]
MKHIQNALRRESRGLGRQLHRTIFQGACHTGLKTEYGSQAPPQKAGHSSVPLIPMLGNQNQNRRHCR